MNTRSKSPTAISACSVSEKTYTVTLYKYERELEVPSEFAGRVSAGKGYTYKVFTSEHTPEHGMLRGDIWVKTTEGSENIYYYNDIWRPWRRPLSQIDEETGCPRNIHHMKRTLHPWLSTRKLQFDGTKLTWDTQCRWQTNADAWNLNVQPRSAGSTPEYGMLTVPFIARYILQREPFLPRIESASPPSSPAIPLTPEMLAETMTACAVVAAPLAATCSPTITAQSQSPTLTDSGTDSGTAYSPPREVVKVKCEPISPILVYKRARSGSSSSDTTRVSEPPTKKIKMEPQAQAHSFTPPPAIVSPQLAMPIAFYDQDPYPCSMSMDTRDFFRNLPIALDSYEHLALFSRLGITENSHLRALTLMPNYLLDDFLGFLGKCGVGFIQRLTLRDRLEALRPKRPRAATYTTRRSRPPSRPRPDAFLMRLPASEHVQKRRSARRVSLPRSGYSENLNPNAYLEKLEREDLTLLEVFAIKACTYVD